MAVLLMYNISGIKADQIRLLCESRKILPRIVMEHEKGTPIGQLAGRLILGSPARHETFSEEMLVLADFTPLQLDDFLKSYRDAGIAPVPLKAVLTESNMTWSAGALCRELKREREEMTRRFGK